MKKFFLLTVAVFGLLNSLDAKTIKALDGSRKELPESVHKRRTHVSYEKVDVAILLTSDSRGKDSIEHVKKTLERKGHNVVDFKELPNDTDAIKKQLQSWIDKGVQVIITVGGTGFAPRDTTVDVVQSLTKKDVPGFGELFRMMTWERWKTLPNGRGILAMTNRAYAGVVDKTVIFAIPGSPDAVDIAINKLIIPEMPHLAAQFNKK